MATNNDILRKHKLVIDNHTYGYERVDVYDMLDEARADENKKYIQTGQGNDELGHYELFRKYEVD